MKKILPYSYLLDCNCRPGLLYISKFIPYNIHARKNIRVNTPQIHVLAHVDRIRVGGDHLAEGGGVGVGCNTRGDCLKCGKLLPFFIYLFFFGKIIVNLHLPGQEIMPPVFFL